MGIPPAKFRPSIEIFCLGEMGKGLARSVSIENLNRRSVAMLPLRVELNKAATIMGQYQNFYSRTAGNV